ncbi:hypothetical protein GCM10009530_67060 [Microbispora corallina]|uniref:Transposase n=1 Tax=Microbispora corallina TaxID=83302 RepID=A0ABQ4G561_9ACTN|nr:hypothetical protein [Microbispora corallina]GIH42218.1 hypothetical protein Mco01_52180 [Microbispora corallina]
MDLDEAAGRLYGLTPDEFTAARDALAKEAKAAGDAALAKGIRALRRPTVVAWAVNQASRRHAEELDALLDVGRRLRAAWQTQDADALAELGRERSAATARLTRAVRDDAEADGRPLSSSGEVEVEQTLDAAVVDEDAAGQVREGRLVRPLSYSGFAPAPVVREPRERRTAAPAHPGKEDREAAAAERERRAAELERALEEAERAAAEAEEARTAWEAELADAAREHDGRSAKVRELSDALAAAKEELATAGHRLEVARREEAAAGRTARSARARADRAAQALHDARS